MNQNKFSDFLVYVGAGVSWFSANFDLIIARGIGIMTLTFTTLKVVDWFQRRNNKLPPPFND